MELNDQGKINEMTLDEFCAANIHTTMVFQDMQAELLHSIIRSDIGLTDVLKKIIAYQEQAEKEFRNYFKKHEKPNS